MSFTIPHDHPALPGHFPGNPLVPAVVLIDHASEAAREEHYETIHRATMGEPA